MTILHRLYDTAVQAERAITALQAAGIPSEQLSLIMGTGVRDGQAEPTGSFATGDGHDHGAHVEPVGSFATGDGHDHDTLAEPAGSFAGGDSRTQREGSFADVDRDTITTFSAGTHRVSTGSHQQIIGQLVAAGMDRTAAESQLAAIHQGKAIVLVQVASQDVERVRNLL